MPNPNVMLQCAAALGCIVPRPSKSKRSNAYRPLIIRFLSASEQPGVPSGIRPMIVTLAGLPHEPGKITDLDAVSICMPVREI